MYYKYCAYFLETRFENGFLVVSDGMDFLLSDGRLDIINYLQPHVCILRSFAVRKLTWAILAL